MLQTHAADLDMLAKQVAHSKAWREATNERILKIEEKEDNRIACLEAQLEGLLLAQDPDAKRSEAWLELVKPSTEKTSQATPPLIPMMPSTSQHVEKADLVAFVVCNRDPDPAALSGTGKRVPSEDQGKVDNKGKLSPQLMVEPGATSSTSFMGVSPPFSPRKGHAALVSGLVVGGIGGHMKLEPPTKFTRKGFPTIQN